MTIGKHLTEPLSAYSIGNVKPSTWTYDSIARTAVSAAQPASTPAKNPVQMTNWQKPLHCSTAHRTPDGWPQTRLCAKDSSIFSENHRATVDLTAGTVGHKSHASEDRQSKHSLVKNKVPLDKDRLKEEGAYITMAGNPIDRLEVPLSSQERNYIVFIFLSGTLRTKRSMARLFHS